jgi:diguanylate cyclase
VPQPHEIPVDPEELEHAITGGELRVYFQPLWEAHSRLIAGFEALVRWQHPKRGLLSPSIFLPVAEAGPLIGPLTDWVLDEALRHSCLWRSQGFSGQVAVNLSAKLLSREGLVDDILDALARHNVAPQILILEVTESALAKRPDVAARTIRELRRSGIKLSVDDFGTGYTSLAQLKEFEFDELKIDGSFVANIRTSPTDSAIVHSILELGHRLGLRVVAECIEDAATARMLAELGCDVLQGYFLGVPMAAEAVPHLLEEQARGTSTSPSALVGGAAPLPPLEERRLKALHDLEILDTEPEPEFDDIAKLAALICGTPTALISFVDAERQWFKSRFGLDAVETHRDSAFCAHAILGESVLEVPDASGDPRFARNPLVVGAPHIRFYAGAPLVTEEGQALGTLCVLSPKPKTLSAEQSQALKRLALIVMDRLNSRRNELILRRLSLSLMTLSQLHDPADAVLAADTIVNAGRRLLGADGVVLMLAESPGAVLFRALGVSAEGPSRDAARSLVIDIRLDPGTTAAVDRGTPVFLPRAGEGRLFDESSLAGLNAASLLYMPIINESGAVGLLVFWWEEQHPGVDAIRRDAAVLLAAEAGTMVSRHQALSALRRAAETDALTGLSNRRACMEGLRRLPPGSSIIVIDLDHFKRVNDKDGHQAGDQLLRTFAAHLRSVVRSEDVVGRWGGEEFLIALPDAGIETGKDTLARLRHLWQPPTARASFSAGLVSLGLTESSGAALNRADAALYKAKDRGRDQDYVDDAGTILVPGSYL